MVWSKLRGGGSIGTEYGILNHDRRVSLAGVLVSHDKEESSHNSFQPLVHSS